MPEVKITIGGREFEVACQTGEEHYLKAAASMLDAEASVLSSQIGRLPENRMLLMSGLMLADKTAGLEEQMRTLEEKLAAQQTLIDELRSQPKPEPQKVEVPVIPADLTDSLAEMTARAESLAAAIEEKAAN
ncbi:MAG TPA: cell division protein ZapA [Rhodobacteraceae bacterium]|nr:cell division protein ZapA [Paracoccaceae bacterium]